VGRCRVRKLDQSGSHIVVVLLVILIVSVLGFGGYYVYTQNNDTQSDKATSNTETPPDKTDPKVESSDEGLITTTVTTVLQEGGSLSVTHPKSWEVRQETYSPDPSYSLRKTYIKSAKGNYLDIREIDGIGGACDLGERTDTFTLRHRFTTAIPGIVFSEYAYSEPEQKTALKLENHSSAYIDASVVAMKEGQTLTDTCRLYIYPVIPLNGDTSLFVSLSKGTDDDGSLLPENLTYDELMEDPEFFKAVQSLSK
jgi:hypothetical protein